VTIQIMRWQFALFLSRRGRWFYLLFSNMVQRVIHPSYRSGCGNGNRAITGGASASVNSFDHTSSKPQLLPSESDADKPNRPPFLGFMSGEVTSGRLHFLPLTLAQKRFPAPKQNLRGSGNFRMHPSHSCVLQYTRKYVGVPRRGYRPCSFFFCASASAFCVRTVGRAVANYGQRQCVQRLQKEA